MSSAHPELVELPGGVELDRLRFGCVHVLQPLRDRIRVPVIPTSGYRGDALNRAVGGVPTSHHRLGYAADIRAPGYTDEQLIAILHDMWTAGELPHLGQVITYRDTGHLHVSWHGEAEFLEAYRTLTGKRKYRAWRP